MYINDCKHSFSMGSRVIINNVFLVLCSVLSISVLLFSLFIVLNHLCKLNSIKKNKTKINNKNLLK